MSQIRKLGYLNSPNVEVEMPYGIRQGFMKQLKDNGYKTRVYVTYGKTYF